MPLSSKGKKLMKKFIETYGNEKAKEVFYASKNKGTIEGVDEITLPPQTKPSKGMKSTSLTRKLKSGEYNRAGKGGGPRISRVGTKQKETDDKRDHGSIRAGSVYKRIGSILAEKKKAGVLGVIPKSIKPNRTLELKAQANSDKDLEL